MADEQGVWNLYGNYFPSEEELEFLKDNFVWENFILEDLDASENDLNVQLKEAAMEDASSFDLDLYNDLKNNEAGHKDLSFNRNFLPLETMTAETYFSLSSSIDPFRFGEVLENHGKFTPGLSEAKKPIITFNFDLDGTLLDASKGIHPDIIFDYLGIPKEEIWKKISSIQKYSGYEDTTGVYYGIITEIINNHNQNNENKLTPEVFLELGKKIDDLLFPGAKDFPEMIQQKFPDLKFRFNLISAGFKPLILGSCFGKSFDHICAYDPLYSELEPEKIIGARTTVSSDEKENIIVRLSYGKYKRGDLDEKRRQLYEFPFKNTIISADGSTDRSMLRMGQKYGAHCFGIIGSEEMRNKAQKMIGDCVKQIYVGDYTPNSELVQEGYIKSIEWMIKNYLDYSF